MISTTDVAIIAAIILGPILSVIISVTLNRIFDARRYEYQRKLDIFRMLMRTRAIPFHEDLVLSLNLVEVDFSKHEKVIEAWKCFHQVFKAKTTSNYNNEDQYKEWESLLTRLLNEMAKVLKIRIETIDILEGKYVPGEWTNEYYEKMDIRHKGIDILSGKTPILVQLLQPHNSESLHSPPPSQDRT